MKKKNKTFKIIKKNYAMFSVIATGSVAMISFLLTLFSYVITCRYFNEWNLPKEIIHLEKDYLFVRIALTIFIFAAGYLFDGYLIEVIQSSRKMLNNRKQMNIFLDSYAEKIGDEYNTAIDNQAKIDVLMIKFFAEKIFKVFFATPILLVSIYMTVVVVGNRNVNNKNAILICLGALAVFVLYAIIDSESVKANSPSSLDDLIEKQEELINKIKQSNYTYKHFFNNRNYIHEFYTFLFVIIEICAGIIFTMKVNINDGFWLYYDKDENYAVVYQTEATMVLERVEFNNSELIIHKNEQLYLENNNIKLKYYPVDSYSLVE